MRRRAVELRFTLAVLVCVLQGCAASSPPLRVGTSGDYSPFSMRDSKTGLRSGFDIDVAQHMARDWGVTIHWVDFVWPNLQASVESNRFDVGMSGITWRRSRAEVGQMTQAVAVGAPCLLGDLNAQRVAVNHGGALEAWARVALADRTLLTVDDNQSLPDLLAAGKVGALVTDSFELASFERAGWKSRCEAATWRKVYWVAPARAKQLTPRINRWLTRHQPLLQQLRKKWFGREQLAEGKPEGRD